MEKRLSLTWPARARVSRIEVRRRWTRKNVQRSGATMPKTNLRFPDFRADAPDEARHDYSGIISRPLSPPPSLLLSFSLLLEGTKAEKDHRGEIYISSKYLDVSVTARGGRPNERATETLDRDWGRRSSVRDIVSGRLADRDNGVTLPSLFALPDVSIVLLPYFINRV